MALPSNYSVALPIEVVASGGLLVRQVDTNGAAVDDSTYVYSVALPCMVVDTNGVNEDGSKVFSVHQQVTLDPRGFPIIRVQPDGTAISTSLLVGGGAAHLGSLSETTPTLIVIGTPSSGTISGATVGSTLAGSNLPPGFTINSGARTWTYDGTVF